MQPKKYERRRHYFIDRQFQLKFIIRFCSIIVAASLLAGVLIYLLNMGSTTVAFENLRVVVKSTSDFILPILLQTLVLVTIFTAIATLSFMVFTSHKISGPLHRLEKDIERMKTGDLASAIHIRADDQLQKVALQVNNLRGSLRETVKELKENWETARKACTRVQASSHNEEEKRRMADNIAKMDQALKRFKLG